jgi:hypothetical protein
VTGALFTQVLPFFDERIVLKMLGFAGAVFGGMNNG